MKLIKNIFARIWAVWGIVTFVATLLIIILPSLSLYMVSQPRRQDLFIKLSRIWMNVWLRLILSPVKVKGWEHFEKGKTYIITFNHNTLMDVPISCPYVPGGNKTIAKKSFAKVPIFGAFYTMGSVLVDRKSDASRRKSIEDMKQTLAKGIHMCIYPEGTRNRTGKPLKEFYDGAFKLATETNKHIIPCLLFNTNKALPNNKTFYLMPQRLEMHFLPPISSENISSKELKEKVFRIMWDYYVAHQ